MIDSDVKILRSSELSTSRIQKQVDGLRIPPTFALEGCAITAAPQLTSAFHYDRNPSLASISSCWVEDKEKL